MLLKGAVSVGFINKIHKVKINLGVYDLVERLLGRKVFSDINFK